MNAQSVKARVTLCAWAIALASFACPSSASTDDAAWPILNRTVDAGTALDPLPARLQVSEERREDGSTIALALGINLSPLRQKLASDKALPQEPCRSFSADNFVAEGEWVGLSVQEGKLKADRRGSLSIWQCLENPVPNTKVEWEIKSVGLGIKTKVPVVKTWPGSPIKNRLLEQSYAASSSFAYDRNSEGALGVQVSFLETTPLLTGPQEAKKALQEPARATTENVKTLLEKIASTETLLTILPAEYHDLKVTLKSAAFSAQGSDPIVTLTFEVKLALTEADAFKKSLLALPASK